MAAEAFLQVIAGEMEWYPSGIGRTLFGISAPWSFGRSRGAARQAEAGRAYGNRYSRKLRVSTVAGDVNEFRNDDCPVIRVAARENSVKPSVPAMGAPEKEPKRSATLPP